jgi:hypothetical protein
MIPVVFTHRGDQDYVQVAVKQAKQWNGRVILLGDEANSDWDVEHYPIADYFSEDAERVADCYEHMCSNPHDFELYNLQEFFVLREFMRRQELDKIFACDSDVMIYADLAEEEKKFGDYLAVYSIPQEQWEYRWSASAHAAYWTFSGLCAFCDFIEKTYTAETGLAKLREKWRWHQENGVGGGVCDMTLLWLFHLESAHLVHDICRVVGDVAFDHNIRVGENSFPDEYRMDGELKQVDWQNSQPHCWHRELERWVRFAVLHFQDGAKPLMGEYYREKADDI